MPKEQITQLTQSELFQKISDICAAVNTVIGQKELLKVSLKQTLELFGAQRGSIFILDENGKELSLKIAQGLAVSEAEKVVKKLGEGVVGHVAIGKKPIFVDDIATDERFRGHKARSKYRTPSFICAPLLLKDQLIGVINISEKGDGTRFSENELQLLDFLSSQIALNYRRTQLYKKFKSIIKESQDLRDELGKSSQEATHLKKKVVQHEKLASIGKLAGGIAHEFNNPLDGVMRYTNLCLEQVSEDDVIRGYLMEIKQGLNRMANIVRSLLACSRSADISMQKISPNTAMEQALKGMKNSIVHKNIVIKKDLAKGLPEMIDLGLERIFENLIRNSIEAVDAGGTIKVKTSFKNGMLITEIQDNGYGIESDNIEEIFEPFHTTKDIDKGCGLGLTIVNEVVKGYGGHISVESNPKKGTSFTVTIPTNIRHE